MKTEIKKQRRALKAAPTALKVVSTAGKVPPAATRKWRLKLYVAGMGAKSLAAFGNLKTICEQHLPGEYEIEIIDLIERPQLAKGDQILAVPTLVRQLPSPIRKIIGDLSNTERVLVGLDIKPVSV